MSGRYGLLLIFWIVTALAACGEGASERDSAAPAFGEAHEPGWRFTHDSAAAQGLDDCRVCHGVDLSGSGRVPACTDCHLGGPPFFIHPPSPEATLDWRHPVNHGREARKDIAGCQGCHGRPGGPGSNPAFDLPIGALERGCEDSPGCHDNGNPPFASFENGHNRGAAHPAFDPTDLQKPDQRHWYGESIEYRDAAGELQRYTISHYDAGNVEGACTLCHGASLEGGSGPACGRCHVLNPLEAPGGCVSCHGEAPVRAPEEVLADSGRQDSLDPAFIEEVISGGFHLGHDAIACEERDNQEDCRTCHGTTESKRIGELHHSSPQGVLCLNCHTLQNIGVAPFPGDCSAAACHPQLFPDQPCP